MMKNFGKKEVSISKLSEKLLCAIFRNILSNGQLEISVNQSVPDKHFHVLYSLLSERFEAIAQNSSML